MLLLGVCPAGAVVYRVTEIGTLGGAQSVGYAVDATGRVVGESTTASGETHAFIYAAGVLTDLGTPGLYSAARAINDAGVIVGEATFPGTSTHAFVYRDGVMSDLGTLPGQDGSTAFAINAGGQVAGISQDGIGTHAFLYAGGALEPLPPLPGGAPLSAAYGINTAGQVVGTDLLAAGNHAFLFDGSTIADLGTLPGDSDSIAFAVNDASVVVGRGDGLAFVYGGGVMRALGPFPGERTADARAINRRGWVVGAAGIGSGSHAFVSDGVAFLDLNALLAPGTTLELYGARGINDAGQIVANALVDGASRAVLLTPDHCDDGVLDPGEACDDGNLTSGDGCDVNCTPTGCGNGVVTAGEACDDGNRTDGDGCSATCRRESTCGDGIVDPGEACDDREPDDCTADCARPALGVTHVSVSWNSPRTGMRAIAVEVWYPAPAGGRPWDVPWGGARDAPIVLGRLPLVVFSHGFQETEGPDIELAYARMLRRLALAGFVVAAVDHPQDDLPNFGSDLVDRPLDIETVLDLLLDDARTAPVLRGHVDAARVGLLGHSYGGYTVFAAAANSRFSTRDPRVKAVAGLAPGTVLTDDELRTVRAPTLIVSGALDDITLAPYFHERPYSVLGAPKFFVQYVDGDHFVYSDACESSYCRAGQTDRYVAGFFRSYLADDPSLEGILEPGAEAVFGNIRFRSERGPALLPGGIGATDCAVEVATQIPDAPGAAAPRRLSCRDGDPCDGDPRTGRCGFAVQLCTNEVDRHLLGCEATDVANVRVRGTRRNPDLAALSAATDAIVPTAERRCGAPTAVTVTIPPGQSAGRRVIRTLALRSDGTRDADRFVLRCEAR